MLAWAAMHRAGLARLKLTPAQFWALTPHDLLVMLGLDQGPAAMTRDRLTTLMDAFPDTDRDSEDKGHDNG